MNRIRARAHTRFRVDLPARFRASGTFHWREGSLINLSKGGICLEVALKSKGESSEALKAGASLEVEIPTVDREGKPQQRRMDAEIQWKKGRRYGLRFLPGKRSATKSSKKNRRALKPV